MKSIKTSIAVFMTAFVGAGAFIIGGNLPSLDLNTIKPVEAATNLETYYGKVNGSGAALLESVRSAISSGYKSIGYDGLYNTYKKTDNRSDGKVRDLYSDHTNFTHVSKKCGNYSSIGDCYNREHSIPQSWWGGGTSNQGCDVYIVWPSDGKINGMRSAFPYGETSNGTRYALSNDPAGNRLGTSTSTEYVLGTVFEPFDDRKGDLARTYFYAVARWSAAPTWTSNDGHKVFTKNGNNGFVQKYLDMLLKWHKLDPVSEFEINRNNYGQQDQGNRNPFVDHPSWVDLIWGGTYEGLNAEDSRYGTVTNGKLDGSGTEVHLSSLLCEGQTDSYYVGNTFTVDGNFYALYSSGIKTEVTPTINEMPDMSTAGTKTVEFSYTDDKGETATYTLNIEVEETPVVEAIELIVSDPKTEYVAGDTFVKPTVELLFSDGHSTFVTSGATVSEVDMSVPGTDILVIVSYEYEGETFSTTYTINISEAEPEPEPEPEPVVLSSISVSSPKVNYNINDTFVKPTVTATYSDGHTADVTNSATFTGYDMSQSGSQTVTVSYTEDNETKTVNYTITIVDNRPIPVSIDVSNIKSEYVIGEAFTPPTVTVTYSDGSTADVTSQSTFSGFNSAADGRIAITVSYTERGVTVTTVFYVRITAPASGGCKGNITATSVILSSLSLVGIVLLILRKRKARV